jgi:hypothetical protein
MLIPDSVAPAQRKTRLIDASWTRQNAGSASEGVRQNVHSGGEADHIGAMITRVAALLSTGVIAAVTARRHRA